MNDLETRIKKGRKAIVLAKKMGMNTDLWESELAKLVTLAHAQEVALCTRELLTTRGWCLWKCSVLNDDITVLVKDELVTGYPLGYAVYTKYELKLITDHDASNSTLRLIHEAKKVAGAVLIRIEDTKPTLQQCLEIEPDQRDADM
ncbi:hypothetical protein ACFLXC_05040 [Chloroflexota bacterium]